MGDAPDEGSDRVDWLARLADVLGEAPMTDAERDTILDLTADVAHTTVRRYAPLSSYLLGLAVARGSRPAGTPGNETSGDERGAAAAALADRLREILPPEHGDPDG